MISSPPRLAFRYLLARDPACDGVARKKVAVVIGGLLPSRSAALASIVDASKIVPSVQAWDTRRVAAGSEETIGAVNRGNSSTGPPPLRLPVTVKKERLM